jgi:hypothetical protein
MRDGAIPPSVVDEERRRKRPRVKEKNTVGRGCLGWWWGIVGLGSGARAQRTN